MKGSVFNLKICMYCLFSYLIWHRANIANAIKISNLLATFLAFIFTSNCDICTDIIWSLQCNFNLILFILRSVCSGLPDSPQQSTVQPVCGSHLLPHGMSEICCQTTCTRPAGRMLAHPFFCFSSAYQSIFLNKVVFSGLLLCVAVHGTAWWVSGEFV